MCYWFALLGERFRDLYIWHLEDSTFIWFRSMSKTLWWIVSFFIFVWLSPPRVFAIDDFNQAWVVSNLLRLYYMFFYRVWESKSAWKYWDVGQCVWDLLLTLDLQWVTLSFVFLWILNCSWYKWYQYTKLLTSKPCKSDNVLSLISNIYFMSTLHVKALARVDTQSQSANCNDHSFLLQVSYCRTWSWSYKTSSFYWRTGGY